LKKLAPEVNVMKRTPLGRPELTEEEMHMNTTYTHHCPCPYITREYLASVKSSLSASVKDSREVHIEVHPQPPVTMLKEIMSGRVRLVDCEEMYVESEGRDFEYMCALIPGWHHTAACPLICSEEFLKRYESGGLALRYHPGSGQK
jgi:hypothetical protein